MTKILISFNLGLQILIWGILLSSKVPNAFAQQSSCSLKLNQQTANWKEEWRTLLYKHTDTNTYRLQRTTYLNTTDILYMICNDIDPIISVKCDSKDGKLTVNLPVTPKCEYENSLAPIRFKNGTTPHCKYDLWTVGVKVIINGEPYFLDTYEICFDLNHLRTLYTINLVFPAGYSKCTNFIK